MIQQVIRCDAEGCGKELDAARLAPMITISHGGGVFHSCGHACRAKVLSKLAADAAMADAVERAKKEPDPSVDVVEG